jgi:hypothetical protein
MITPMPQPAVMNTGHGKPRALVTVQMPHTTALTRA